MKIFIILEKSFKNGFYLDYFFKNFIFFFYKSFLGHNSLYILDKYLIEKVFFFVKLFFTTVQNQLAQISNLNFHQILKLSILIVLQILLIILL